jgi:ribosomal protein S18 acetylase RimI-like enzyme
MNIRPYESKDKEDVRFICLNSEGPCKLSEKDKNYILTTYCDYFIEKESQNCFVAVDENDKAVGYIICAENYDRFIKCFLSEYLLRFKKYEFGRRRAAKKSTDLQSKYKDEYPAHLHIDVLPEYQRKGLGHKLVDTLCEHLKSKGVKGVMLTVWENNEKGQGFYKKYGFTFLEKNKGNVAYGVKL